MIRYIIPTIIHVWNDMKVLVIGSGGREHAIVTSLSKSSRVDKIYCAPGNAGIAALAECVQIAAMDFDGLVGFARDNEIDLTVVGMDDPLVGGIVDAFEAAGLRVFGPNKSAAILEGSKAFSKDLMKKYGIPTATYENFDNPAEAIAYLKTVRFPIVLKADGLALGKGVIIDGDKGPNTGGMGNFSPSPFYTAEVHEYCMEHIYQPTVDAMAREGRPFKGVIFFGLMLTDDGPKVLEYNARFGDPEAQVVLPRLKNDVVDVFEACIDGTLDRVEMEFEPDKAAVCVVLASDGYPVSYEKGFPIRGLDKFDGKEDYYCFHAGTAFRDGEIVTNGGRVLGITAIGSNLREARDKAYEATEWVSFDNKYMRHDIGKAIDEA